MIFLAKLDPIVGLISIVAVSLVIIGLVLKRLKQPYIVGYILVGAILGDHGLGIIQQAESIQHLGEVGIILLMFFIGMEISIPDFLKTWKLAVFSTLLQVSLSVAVVLGIGFYFDWVIARSIVLGFIIALSSSAVVIKLLTDKQLIDTKIGKNVLSILLTQDIIIVPLLILTSQLGGVSESTEEIVYMIVGGALIVAILLYIYVKRTIRIPFEERLASDHELQVFVAGFLCFGGAILTSFFGLSAALGAFVGGMVMHTTKATEWIHDTLNSFRVLFVAFFFISIGLQLDLDFVRENIATVSLVLLSVYIINHFLNTVILRIFSCPWKEAIYGGALLAQIGELSFLICSMAFSLNIIGTFGYNFTICLISLTLLISPFWILLTEKLIHFNAKDTGFEQA